MYRRHPSFGQRQIFNQMQERLDDTYFPRIGTKRPLPAYDDDWEEGNRIRCNYPYTVQGFKSEYFSPAFVPRREIYTNKNIFSQRGHLKADRIRNDRNKDVFPSPAGSSFAFG